MAALTSAALSTLREVIMVTPVAEGAEGSNVALSAPAAALLSDLIPVMYVCFHAPTLDLILFRA